MLSESHNEDKAKKSICRKKKLSRQRITWYYVVSICLVFEQNNCKTRNRCAYVSVLSHWKLKSAMRATFYLHAVI